MAIVVHSIGSCSFDCSAIVALQGISPFELQAWYHDNCYDSKDSGGGLEIS